MQKLEQQYRDRGVVVLAINWRDTAAVIKEYFDEQKFPFQPLQQKDEEVSQAYGVRTYPTNYIITPDGRIAAAMVGFKEASAQTQRDRAVR